MSASKITLQFNKAMASPTGKEAEFGVSLGAGEYQSWDIFTVDSPVLTANYPYQVIIRSYFNGGFSVYLYVSTRPIYYVSTVKTLYFGTVAGSSVTSEGSYYILETDVWTFVDNMNIRNLNTGFANTFYECNADIYTDNTFTTVYFSKTTSVATLTIDTITQPTTTTYQVNIAEALTASDVITCDYTKGTIKSSDGGVLESFSTSVANGIT